MEILREPSEVSVTIVEDRPDTLTADANPIYRCEDCPDINDNPPPQSECEYFYAPPGAWPECNRDKSGEGGDTGPLITRI